MKYYKICPHCNIFCRIEEKDEYCSNCGAELISECPKCKKGIDNPYATFCKYCGNEYRTKKIENDHFKF